MQPLKIFFVHFAELLTPLELEMSVLTGNGIIVYITRVKSRTTLYKQSLHKVFPFFVVG